MVEFRALGGLAVTADGEELSIGGARLRRLLAMLLIHCGDVVSVDRLADAVFAGEPTPAASTTLRSYVARIRRVIERDEATRIVTTAPGYVLHVSPGRFDVTRFEQLLAEAGARLAGNDAQAAASSAASALGLWRGEAYAEFADEDWVLPEAQRLEELRLVAHERLVEAELASGRVVDILPTVDALVAAHPLRETFRSQLVVALYRSGRQADALRALQAYRQLLREELGLELSPPLVDLERAVLAHEPSLTEPAGVHVRGYRLGERLGTGHAGTVYAARAVGVDRDLAIRIYRPELADEPEFVRTFDSTAYRVASLRHPAIVPIHDHWRQPGAAYVVMRRLRGGTLADRLVAGPLSRPALAAVVARVGGALAAAAERGIEHGHVVAESVLFDGSGEAFLGDFHLGGASPGVGVAGDVSDLADLVARCGAPTDAVAAVLAQAAAVVGRPTMAEFAPALVNALAEDAALWSDQPVNPYKGLRAFDEADALDFFGRHVLLDEVLGRLAADGGDGVNGRLVLIVGGSGTGKSSVVRAGLLPLVRAGAVAGSDLWYIAAMVPGVSPYKELAACLQQIAVESSAGLVEDLAADATSIDSVISRLTPDGSQVLLVVDQFEELFTLAGDDDRRAFLDALVYAVQVPDGRLRVVATLRADFYDRPLAVAGFGALVNAATVTIPPMTPGELEAAIVEPALRAGRSVERALVAELVHAVVDQPAALPSLQYTLYELADRCTGAELTLASYRELGGTSGAVAARAESLYTTLDDSDRVAVRRMFERLVVVSGEGEPTRRRAERTELTLLGAGLDAELDRWAAARLLTLDHDPRTRLPTVEVAHEALLRAWPRLGGWLAEDRGVIVELGHLRDAAASWLAIGQDPGALYRGARLQLATEAVEQHGVGLTGVELEFLDASRDAAEADQRQARERAARQSRANRRLRIQLGVIVVALLVALVGGYIALDQRRHADRERTVATARELAAASEANVEQDPELSILLARAAIETTEGEGTVLPEAEEAMHRAVTASRVVLAVPGIGGALDWSADGSMFVTEGPEESGLIDVRDATTGASIRSWHGHDVDVNDVAFSARSSLLATVGDDGAVRVWDPRTGRLVAEHRAAPTAIVSAPSLSPDGSLVAAMFGPDVGVLIVDTATGDVHRTIPTPGRAFATSFSPDGTRLAIGTAVGDTPVAARVVDVASGAELFSLGDDFVRDVAWSPNGRWLATTGDDRTVNIWSAADGTHAATITGHSGGVNGLTWNPDSIRLATASDDGTARVWSFEDGTVRELLRLSTQGTRDGLVSVAFSPDGERLMAGDWGVNAVTVWDIGPTGGREWLATDAAPETTNAGAFDAAGDAVVIAVPGGGVSKVAVGTGVRTPLVQPSGGPDVTGLALGPDGAVLATATDDGVTTIRDIATGRVIADFTADGDTGLAWSGDGQVLALSATIDDHSKVTIVNRAGSELASMSNPHDFYIPSVSVSPDGRLVAFTRGRMSRDDPDTAVVTVWDWKSDHVERTIRGDTGFEFVSFDPTGERVVVSGRLNGLAEVWDITTGKRVSTLASPPMIADLTFNPDGTTIATSHTDGTVRLWDSTSGVQRLQLQGHDEYIGTVAFSPDGSKLLSISENGLVRVWAIDLNDLLTIAAQRLTRGFSADECRQYLHLTRCPTS